MGKHEREEVYCRGVRIITLNVNGVRSAASKGLFDWLKRQRADVVCLQETKVQEPQLAAAHFRPRGYHCFYYDAERKGYSGTALFARREPDAVVKGFGTPEFDREGRYLEARFGKLSVVSVYPPSGSAGPERQASKFRFLDCFQPHLQTLRRSRRQYVLCGDWNIAHKEIDLKNWRSNRKNSGFLPEERAWLDELFGPMRYVDAFRQVNDKPHQYTWWSNRGRAWEKNVGWRIDYQVVKRNTLRDAPQRASIFKAHRFSDHAPLIMDYDLDRGREPIGHARLAGRIAGLPPAARRRDAVPGLLCRAPVHARVPDAVCLVETGWYRARRPSGCWLGWILYSIKVLWAPIVDRVPIPVLNRVLAGDAAGC